MGEAENPGMPKVNFDPVLTEIFPTLANDIFKSANKYAETWKRTKTWHSLAARSKTKFRVMR